ncbi:MAG: hypothetical protein R3B93_19490 [Bacteroidia bacterium]
MKKLLILITSGLILFSLSTGMEFPVQIWRFKIMEQLLVAEFFYADTNNVVHRGVSFQAYDPTTGNLG